MKSFVTIYILTKLELGGAQKVCLTLFNDLQKNDTIAYLISGSTGLLAGQVQHNKNVYLLPSLKREVSWRLFKNELKTFFELVKCLKKIKQSYSLQTPIIVHTHSTKAGIMGRWAAFFAGIPYRVHTIHGYAFHDHQHFFSWFAVYFLELLTCFITSHFVCVSLHDAQKGNQLLYGFKNKFSLIRAGVEINNFLQPNEIDNKQNETFVFGTISCFKPQKNIFDIIKAFHLVYTINHRVRLEIIGDGILRPQLENLIRQYKLEKKIVLHGWQESPKSIMKKWHAFVLSSLWEGLPCSIIEARLLHLPVISYATGGISEVIMHGKNGFLYPQKQWRNLAYGMLSISTDKKLYKKLTTYNDVLHDFDNNYMVNEHIKLYEKLSK